jgi:hypothetical protein
VHGSLTAHAPSLPPHSSLWGEHLADSLYQTLFRNATQHCSLLLPIGTHTLRYVVRDAVWSSLLSSSLFCYMAYCHAWLYCSMHRLGTSALSTMWRDLTLPTWTQHARTSPKMEGHLRIRWRHMDCRLLVWWLARLKLRLLGPRTGGTYDLLLTVHLGCGRS